MLLSSFGVDARALSYPLLYAATDGLYYVIVFALPVSFLIGRLAGSRVAQSIQVPGLHTFWRCIFRPFLDLTQVFGARHPRLRPYIVAVVTMIIAGGCVLYLAFLSSYIPAHLRWINVRQAVATCSTGCTRYFLKTGHIDGVAIAEDEATIVIANASGTATIARSDVVCKTSFIKVTPTRSSKVVAHCIK